MLLAVLSPAKSLDYDSPVPAMPLTQPQFMAQAAQLVDVLRLMAPAQLASLMSISDKLAVLNASRYEAWAPAHSKPTAPSARAAVFAFNGDVYEGLDAKTLTLQALQHANQHLCILSGLYGALRPLDVLQAYRLEMGTRLQVDPRTKDLYAFWKPLLANYLNARLHNINHTTALQQTTPVLINLASDEYFKAIDLKTLNARVVQPVFQDAKGGQYKVVSFYAKKARGLMARFICEHGIGDACKVDVLKNFNVAGYAYSAEASSANTWVFRREEQA